jgi:glycosyltransferase involved in cell wall biosynthesis
VTVGNETLAVFARQFAERVTVVPTVVATERYELHALHDASRADADAPPRLRVGWLGSDLSIRETLFPYWEMFARLQARIGFDFVICSRPRPLPPSDALRWSFVEWSPETEEHIASHIDVGVMPLVDTEFQRGKCGLKLLQYMAAGIPVVASSVGVNRSIVEEGMNGYAATSEEEWGEALAALAASPDLRRRMGAEGRRVCVERYSLSGWAPVLLDIFDRVLGTPAPSR